MFNLQDRIKIERNRGGLKTERFWEFYQRDSDETSLGLWFCL